MVVDLTLVHDASVRWRDIRSAIESRRSPELEEFWLEVVYPRRREPAKPVHTTIRFVYRAGDRSLTQEEVNQRHLGLAEELRRRFGAQGETA